MIVMDKQCIVDKMTRDNSKGHWTNSKNNGKRWWKEYTKSNHKIQAKPMTYNSHHSSFLRELFQAPYENYKTYVQAPHYHTFIHISHFKRTHITCHTRN